MKKKQLTFFYEWYDHFIGLKMYSDHSSDFLTIDDIVFDSDPFYKNMIIVSFKEVKSKQGFQNRRHFLNWFDHLGIKS